MGFPPRIAIAGVQAYTIQQHSLRWYARNNRESMVCAAQFSRNVTLFTKITQRVVLILPK